MIRELGWIAGGLGLGAALLYLFHPDEGARRRAALRTRLAEGNPVPEPAAPERQLGHRLEGVMAGKLVASAAPPEDHVLGERVRVELPRLVSHPDEVEVTTSGGHVLLSGHVLQAEVEDLIRGVSWLPGVERVEVELGVHRQRDTMPAGEGTDAFGQGWPDHLRMLAGAAGCLLLVGVVRRDPVTFLMGSAGLVWTTLHLSRPGVHESPAPG